MAPAPWTQEGYVPWTGSEFVFTEPTLLTRLATLLAAGTAVVAAAVATLFWLVRRLRARRRSARHTAPPPATVRRPLELPRYPSHAPPRRE